MSAADLISVGAEAGTVDIPRLGEAPVATGRMLHETSVKLMRRGRWRLANPIAPNAEEGVLF